MTLFDGTPAPDPTDPAPTSAKSAGKKAPAKKKSASKRTGGATMKARRNVGKPAGKRTVVSKIKEVISETVKALAEEFNGRNGGLQLREVAGGWQFTTRPEYHEHVRAFLKTRPSAKLTIASLETLAVIAYRQPVTVPEILEIRGVQSPSSIKTLLDKKLIVAKGRKDTVGRPMMYGTSKEFLLQFGLKDLSELPSVEDFHDLSGGS